MHSFKHALLFGDYLLIFNVAYFFKMSLRISDVCRCSHDLTKCVPSPLYRKISLSQLPRETKTQRHHTTASRDTRRPADPVYPCANAEMLQDEFSADASCTEVTAGQSHPLSHPTLC